MEETSTVAVESGYHEVAATENLSLDSEPIAVQPNQVYEAKAWVVGFEGSPGCALVVLIFLDETGKEVGRESALIDDFSGRAKQYMLQSKTPQEAKHALLGFRVNTELPTKCSPADAKLWLQPPDSVRRSPREPVVQEKQERPVPHTVAVAETKEKQPAARDANQAVALPLAHNNEPRLAEIPMPPVELRKLTGLTEEAFYDNPSRDFVYPNIPSELYESVFDFGCGCGRLARQLMLQRTPPKRYLGIDINRMAIEWSQQNLTPANAAFRFEHHDVYNITMAPDNSKNRVLPVPAADSSFSLVIAHSVFTHLLQDQAEFDLGELRRILRPDGLIRSTWFFFYKDDFTVLADHQNCLFVNETDPTQAVFYDYNYFLRLIKATGLDLVSLVAPQVKNFQWEVRLKHAKS